MFERDVRPILKANCFHCHGEGDELQGGLDLRLVRLMAAGGDSGPAIAPGDVDNSVLLARIKAGEMPPEDVQQRLTAAEVASIERWIAGGAPTARPEPETLEGVRFTTEEREFWAYQPVQRPQLPVASSAGRARTPIDLLVLAELEKQDLTFSADADKLTLLRRACFDLTGLPPTPGQAQAFLADESPGAYERLIDRLLASPQYGERWGRHWLDVAGYADSEGYTDDDKERPDAYKYRDYVVRSLNAGKPLDEFVVQQLAGDELVAQPHENLDAAAIENLTATGFLRMAPDGTAGSGIDAVAARNEVIADTIKIVSTSLLGLTVGCAQCHNHRYDPIPHADYFRFRALFAPGYDSKNWRTPPQRRLSLYTDADRRKAAEIEAEAKKIDEARTAKQNEYIEQTFEQELAKLPEEMRDSVRAARNTPDKERTPQQQELLKQYPSVNVNAGSLYLYDSKAAADLKKMADEAAQIRATKPVEQFLRVLTEPADQTPPATHLFYRGDPEQPREEVAPGELSIITAAALPIEIPSDDPALPTSGRRLAYARWLTSGEHPLLARVLANRVWLHLFGRGIVETPGDFGYLGARPTHPQLLDWMADELVASGWSLKRLQKLIMTSTVYRQASLHEGPGAAADPENRLYWRMAIRRVEAEALRDRTLAVSGEIVHKQFGPPVPVMADEVGQFVIGVENLDAGRPGAVIPMQGEDLRRSVYVQVRRSRPLGVLDTFDAPAMSPNCTERASSTVAPQSLLLMNSKFITDRALALARRVQREAGPHPTEQIKRAWLLAYSAPPSDEQLQAAATFLAEQTANFQALPPVDPPKNKEQDQDPVGPQLEALASFCHALFSSNEFLYID